VYFYFFWSHSIAFIIILGWFEISLMAISCIFILRFRN